MIDINKSTAPAMAVKFVSMRLMGLTIFLYMGQLKTSTKQFGEVIAGNPMAFRFTASFTSSKSAPATSGWCG